MPRADYGELAQLQTRWENDPYIPNWKKVELTKLLDILRKRAEDNRGKLNLVQLYYPDDCHNYDVFIMVVHALDALMIPTSNGYIARDFGAYSEIE